MTGLNRGENRALIHYEWQLYLISTVCLKLRFNFFKVANLLYYCFCLPVLLSVCNSFFNVSLCKIAPSITSQVRNIYWLIFLLLFLLSIFFCLWVLFSLSFLSVFFVFLTISIVFCNSLLFFKTIYTSSFENYCRC